MGVNPRLLRRSLLDNGYTEIHVTGEHAVAIDALPPIHKDPFDRLLIAQATVEGITLLTVAGFWRAIPVQCGRSNTAPYS
jgi:PIN domain nuclease of toxin-antitoxin system